MKHSQMYFLAMIIAFCTDKWLLGFTLVIITIYQIYKENQINKLKNLTKIKYKYKATKFYGEK
jgi:hypothetical protein